MVKKLIIFISLSGIAGLVWLANLKYEDVDVSKVVYTLVAIAVSYLLFKLFLEGIIANRIKESKTRYSFRKTTEILFLVVSFIVVLRIWVINPQALLVAYGLVAAGIAVALQDVWRLYT